MSGVTDYKILELLELESVSNRLRNAVRRAYQRGDMPFETVREYSQSKEEVIRHLHRLPSIGNKTISELIDLLDEYSEGVPGKNLPISTDLSIPDVLKGVGIVTFIRSKNCSARLENALAGAIERHEFQLETLGELDGESVHVLKSKLHQVQNLGRKSIDEFLGALREISLGFAENIDSRMDDQAWVAPKESAIDWASDYLSLLEKERYGDIAVAEIVRRMPSRSKSEEKILDILDKKCGEAPIAKILASSSGGLDELSRELIDDRSLAALFASLMMDFYRFLLSKNNKTFSHEDYFLKDLSCLNEKQSNILLSRFGENKLTLDELGRKLGVTRERVRQIESKAIAKYIKANRVGLFHLAEDIDKYVKASKGVLSVDLIKVLYGTSRPKLEVALNMIVPGDDNSWISRDGDYIISCGFKRRQEKIFRKIEENIFRQAGCGEKATVRDVGGVNGQIVKYFLFVNKKKFSMSDDGGIEIVISSASERARIVLAIAGQPVHTSEAARLYKIIFRENITEHAIASTLGRLPEVLIVGSGTYALYSHLRLNSEDIDSIRDEAYKLIKFEGRYLSSRIIFEHICQIRSDFRLKEPYFSYHLVLGALQDDERYQTKRGFMVGLACFGDHQPLETEVEELVEKYGPVSVSDIIELLRPTRGELTNGSVRNTLVASDEIFLTYEKRKWDVAGRVFSDASDIRKLQVAIRMAAYKEKIALSSVYNRVRSTGINYGIGTIISVVWKDSETKQDGDYVEFFGSDAEIENYYATGEPEKFSQLDYRNYTEERSIDASILEELVKEFDLNV